MNGTTNAMAASIIWSITGTHLPTNSSIAAEHQTMMAGHDAMIFSTIINVNIEIESEMMKWYCIFY